MQNNCYGITCGKNRSPASNSAGRYVVDFVCLANRLAIEADGGQHAEMKLQDRQRDAFLAQEGFRVLRFWNNEVLGNIDGVMESIWAAVLEK